MLPPESVTLDPKTVSKWMIRLFEAELPDAPYIAIASEKAVVLLIIKRLSFAVATPFPVIAILKPVIEFSETLAVLFVATQTAMLLPDSSEFSNQLLAMTAPVELALCISPTPSP